jgi:tRNA(Ile)-lysidine synthase
MPLIDRLFTAWPPDRWRDVTVLVAVSGGADSVALLHALAQLAANGEGRLVIAHFNHRLRGAESDADQQFVESLGTQLGLSLVVDAWSQSRDTSHAGEGLEGSARQARYSFLVAAAGQCGARYVATAHTADDQVETVLFNLIRGTGLAGLAGIPRFRQLGKGATLVRPLLDVTREEVLAYLADIGQEYRDDATNRDVGLARNRIRHQLLPLLAGDFNPHVRDALRRLSQFAGEAQDVLAAQAAAIADRAARCIAGGYEIDPAGVAGVSDLIARYALIYLWQQAGWPQQDMGFKEWDELLSIVRAPSGDEPLATASAGSASPSRRHFPGGVSAEKVGGIVRVSRIVAKDHEVESGDPLPHTTD